MSPERWQAVVDVTQATGRLPSLSAGVLRSGELVWTGTAGEGGSPDVQYRIGSITKTLTVATVLQCRDEGLLSLDDPIGRFIPETDYRDLSLRTMLSHHSGMQSEPVGSWWERSPGVDFATLVSANHAPVAGPGEFFHYSNLAYALLGEAVSRLRGEPWWQVVQSRLLEPLGMGRTSYTPEAPAAQGYSVHHFEETLTREPHQDTGAMAPAGQAWSTVRDLARWASFLASGEPGVLDVESLQEASRSTAPGQEYGLGVRLLPFEGRWLLGHTGSMPGFMATLFVDPGSGDGVVALTNGTTGFDPNTFPEQMLGEGAVPSMPAWHPADDVPELVHELVGLWFWGNTAFELRWHLGTLELHSLAMQQLADQFELRGDEIIGSSGYHRGEQLHVVRRPDGSVSHLDCATFVYTRTPYDPAAPIPGPRP